jgi:hypothetical protein
VRRARPAALPVLALSIALLASGCSHKKATPVGNHLQREDLVLVAHRLRAQEHEAQAEVAATKAAWPLIFRGLPASDAGLARAEIVEALTVAEKLEMPDLFHGFRAAALTGPAFGIAGLYRDFVGLAKRGWAQLGAAIAAIERGSAVARRFARENVGLYIESIYDAHFGLAQIGKKLLDGYKKLKGPETFFTSLTQEEVDALARFYSEAADRLYPHATVKFGT